MKKIRKGLSLFDGKHSRFGGHSQWISKLTGLSYLSIDFGFWGLHYDHYSYDGQHHTLTLIFLRLMWGSKPMKNGTR